MPLTPDHLPPPEDRPTSVLVVPTHDVQWCRPAFRAPSLPTPSQLFGEVPFSAQFAPRRFRTEAAVATR